MLAEAEALRRRPPGKPGQTGFGNAAQNAVALALVGAASSTTQAIGAPESGAFYTFENTGTAEITICFGGADSAATGTLGAADASCYGIAANGGREEWWIDGRSETNFRAFCTVGNTLKYYRSS